MPAPKLRAEYPALAEIARLFEACGQSHSDSARQLRGRLLVLRNGAWVGKAAAAFYAEMDSQVLPAIDRLIDALVQADETTRLLSLSIQNAEREAAAVLRIGDAAPQAMAFAVAGEGPAAISGDARAAGASVLGQVVIPAGWLLQTFGQITQQIADNWAQMPNWAKVMVVLVSIAMPYLSPSMLSLVQNWHQIPDWVKEILKGLFAGDFADDPTWISLLIQFFVGLIPVLGQIADIRDIVAGIVEIAKDLYNNGSISVISVVFLALAIVAIVPGLDAVKALRALKPFLKALGDKNIGELLEYVIKNPREIVRLGGVLWALSKHPQLIDVLAKHGDEAMDLIKRGSPEMIERLARNADKLDDWLSDPSKLKLLKEQGDRGLNILENYDPRFAKDNPNGGLLNDEGVVVVRANGPTRQPHTVDRHVARTDDELRDRLRKELDLDNGASSFNTLTDAERAVADAFTENPNARADILSKSNGETIEIDTRVTGDSSGRHVVDKTANATETSHARVVLIRDDTAPDGYRVFTAFPTTHSHYVEVLTRLSTEANQRLTSAQRDLTRAQDDLTAMRRNLERAPEAAQERLRQLVADREKSVAAAQDVLNNASSEAKFAQDRLTTAKTTP